MKVIKRRARQSIDRDGIDVGVRYQGETFSLGKDLVTRVSRSKTVRS